MPPLALDRLTGAQLEELAAQLLVADKGPGARYSARTPGAHGAGVVLYEFGDSGRWAIECKTDSEALLATILQLPSHQRILQADHALLVTTREVSLSLLEDARRLGVTVWDRGILQKKLERHPAIASEYARSTKSSGGETRVRALELHNFRGIRDMHIEFAGSVTLLVGLNGAGKSAILEALARLLSWPARRIFDRPGGMHFGEYDIHDEASESWLYLEAVLEGTLARWSLRGHRSRGNQSNLLDLKQAVQPIRDALKQSPEASVPLFVYYPVNRAVLDIPRRVRKSEKHCDSFRRKGRPAVPAPPTSRGNRARRGNNPPRPPERAPPPAMAGLPGAWRGYSRTIGSPWYPSGKMRYGTLPASSCMRISYAAQCVVPQPYENHTQGCRGR